jgi:CheY-like chemotaxis protein
MLKKKILIIDDEVGFTRMVKLNVEGTGKYEVRIENKGALALDTAKAFRPDLILLDIIMPDVAGSEVAACLYEDNSTKNIPIVFLTALVTEKELDGSCSIISGYPFLSKPVKLKELIDCIDRHIA